LFYKNTLATCEKLREKGFFYPADHTQTSN